MAVTDGLIITRRNLIKVKRVPDLIVFATLSPIMFVLLFLFVFGGAINVPGDVSYAEFLLPGIFAQTVDLRDARSPAPASPTTCRRASSTGSGRCRWRRSAVLVGRTAADLGLNALSIAVMALTGLLVGWRIHTSVLEAARRLPAASRRSRYAIRG